MFNNIPAEMRDYKQWVVWNFEEIRDTNEVKLTKVPYCPHNGKHASCNDPSTWGSFSDVTRVASSYSGIGFVLTDDDPFAFIDLDEPKSHISEIDRQQSIDRQIKVYNEFDSYAERSPSGKGLHIIVKGSVEQGRKRSSIEVYSNKRFMTMTGDVYKQAPIQERNELLKVLWDQMGRSASTLHCCYDELESETDDAILERACLAINGDKFAALLKGNWQDYYQSQSEADFAFINIVAFYTKNHMQITRIFRNSPLGQTAKGSYQMRGLRVDYVDWMINRSFDRQLPPVDVDGLRIQLETALQAKSQECLKNRLPNLPCDGTLQPPPALPLTQKAPKQPTPATYDAPPGLVGDIARFMFQAAPRPVAEIALAGAIGLMAGICGRSFNVSGTGLNQYVLLLAPTGTGKEAIGSGIDKIMGAVQRTVPAAMEFIGPAEISSPQALIKYMAKTSSSFVSLVGEFGLKLQEMSAYNANMNQIGLRRALLDLYNKSGEGKVLRPTIYSDREKNTEPVLSPSFTLLGESTPEEFYKSLNESMIASGLLPRFTCIEYHGPRPPLNKWHITAVPGFRLIEQISTLCAHSLMLNAAHKAVTVELDAEAKTIFEGFDVFCDEQINSASAELIRHLWNRAHMKGLKLSALIAVGINPYQPTITKEISNWSIKLVCNDVYNMLNKFATGQIGADTEETKQAEEMARMFKDYVTKPYSEIEKYKASTERLHYDKIVTMAYVSRRLAASAIFRKDKLGATNAIKRTLENLKNNGDIREIGPKQVSDTYSYSGKCFAMVNLATFKL